MTDTDALSSVIAPPSPHSLQGQHQTDGQGERRTDSDDKRATRSIEDVSRVVSNNIFPITIRVLLVPKSLH
jgi:hypothetical protein